MILFPKQNFKKKKAYENKNGSDPHSTFVTGGPSCTVHSAILSKIIIIKPYSTSTY
jgi:hypothetical protein